MTRLFHILALLALVTLGLSPLAAAAGHCPTGMTMAMSGDEAPCCPDMAPGEACQTGCAQLVAASAAPVAGKQPQQPRYGMAAPVVGTEWTAPRETEPPRSTLRS